MKPILGRIGPVTIYSYTLLLDIAILIGLVAFTWRGKQQDGRPNAWLDAGLLAVIAGVAGGRVAHVAIHWAYFQENLAETYQVWLGGLDWHGAVIVGLLGLWGGCRLRNVNWRQALDTLSLVLPVGVMLAYGGCLLGRCAVGREVASLADYPPLIAAELPDIFGIVLPRLASQGYGIAAGALLLLMAWGLHRFIRRPGLRFWLILLFTALAAFGIGYTLNDPAVAVAGFRLSQVLDLGVAVLSIAGLVWHLLHSDPASDTVTSPTSPSSSSQRTTHDAI